MSKKSDLKKALFPLVLNSGCTTLQVLELISEVLVREMLQRGVSEPISRDDRRRAHNILALWFTNQHELDVSESFSAAKIKRMLRGLK